jgi:methylmalonyl-CoA/ethylmalonyl-CoA epimerase
MGQRSGFEMITRVGHIGIAVSDLDEALKIYEKTLGLKAKAVKVVEAVKLKIAFLPVGDGEIELLQPLDSDTSIAKFIAAHGEGIHHIALVTDDIEAEMENMRKKGVKFADDKPRIGAHGVKIAFVSPESTHGVTVELCEEVNSPES